ncbi:MAG: hypothetical protein P4L31_02390 [Candidatus Babeliales bacterium]|nr:hypothetical protein [Candidatus Babeliales bacterium]
MNKTNIQIKAKGIATAVGVIVSILYCCFTYSVGDIKNENDFYKKIQRSPFTVAMFYKDDKANRAWHNNLAVQKRNFKKLSREGFYRNGDVQFLEADITRKHLAHIKTDFRITDVPAMLLFNYGKVVRNADNEPALLVDKNLSFLRPDSMRKFINSYLREDIEDYIEQNTERKVEDRILRDYSGYITYGAGVQPWPYYAPYYGGYGGYYGGPGVGFGVSVGF